MTETELQRSENEAYYLRERLFFLTEKVEDFLSSDLELEDRRDLRQAVKDYGTIDLDYDPPSPSQKIAALEIVVEYWKTRSAANEKALDAVLAVANGR